MKQLAQYQDGRLELQDVPVPGPPPGGVLVRVTHSIISPGTERMKVEQARMNLLQKARARPDQVRKVVETARTLGWPAALEKVRNRLETPTPLGYSAAGIVEAADAGNTRLQVGDRVACGGAECAYHAEYIAVPDMLVARVPEAVDNWRAAYTTIAAIGLQAVRQLDPALGDRVLVIGQGLVGLLVTALLKASGARVLAVDLVATRERFARSMGADEFVHGTRQSVVDHVQAWTGGWGVDGVVLATATQSNTPTEQAVELLRDRGRISVVGNTKVDLPWKIAYEKEIEVRYSRSYGPGRYDSAYEWGGVDYPIGYVRWTEQRNFDACLYLMEAGLLDVGPITTRRLPFDRALDAYRDLASAEGTDLGVVLEYGNEPGTGRVSPPASDLRPGPRGPADGAVGTLAAPVRRVDAIGAGNFARTMLLPHLKGRVPLGTVVNNTALSARHVQTKFGFAKAETISASVFGEADPSAAVLIATRHHLHAPLVLSALAVQRHVFVEKPLCLTRQELAAIDLAVAAGGGSVQVGFNRRFAPAAVELKRLVDGTPGPKSVSYRVVAGKLDPQHWYANYAESGGRVLGEACHFLDFFCFLLSAGSEPLYVTAQTTWSAAGRMPFPDSVTCQVEFTDGSSGQLIYSAEGAPSWPKEQCSVYGAGLVAELTNCQTLTVHQARRKTTRTFRGKGHAEQMEAWAAFLRAQARHPLPYADSRRSMLVTFAVLDSIRERRTVSV